MNDFFLGLEMPKGKKLADLFLDHSISLGHLLTLFRELGKKNCIARAGARTLDVQVKSLTLYQLSYPGCLKI